MLQMSHTNFLDVISPMWANDTEVPHIMAVLKRTNLLVNAGKLLLFRKASADHTKVPCLCMQNAVDYLKPEAQRKYMEYRDGKLQISLSLCNQHPPSPWPYEWAHLPTGHHRGCQDGPCDQPGHERSRTLRLHEMRPGFTK